MTNPHEEFNVVVTAKDGLHLVPVSRIVKLAQETKSEGIVTVQGKNPANITDIFGLMLLAIAAETPLKIQVTISEDSERFRQGFIALCEGSDGTQ
ncbi:hypothetical protein FJZ27_02310 [Candidatus Peribacteria bacterium]|nr:hypothetical protein [Candidatus Peribacteria bacterium]